MDSWHVPVLVDEVLSWLPAKGLVVDGTVGDGGHVSAIIAHDPKRAVIGVDRDPISIKRTKQRLTNPAVTLRSGSYADLLAILTDQELAAVRYVLLDLGFSSAQMDNQERGLSFMADGPLDMRFNQQDMHQKTAAEIVNRTNETELANIIYQFGEEGHSRQIARAIVEARQLQPITTTGQLAAIIEKVVPRHPKDKLHPATLTFQALRIAVNQELAELDYFLKMVVPALPVGCRVAIISFHSLEDRQVKQAFRNLAKPLPNEFGERVEPLVSLLTKKPQVGTPTEIAANPRARSAKLRVIERI